MPQRSASNTGLVVGLGSIGVILLVAMMVVAFIASNGAFGDDTGDDTGRTVGWQVAKRDGDGDTAAIFPTKAGTIVRVGTSVVVGYDLGTGDRDWQVRLPTDFQTCASTNIAPDNIAAIVMGSAGECTDVVAIDVKKGRQVWRAQLRNDAGQAPRTAAVTTAKGRVFVSTASGIARYDAKRGPEATGDAAPGFGKAPRGCEFGGSTRANDKAVLAIMQCTIPPRTRYDQPKFEGYLVGLSATSLEGILRKKLATGNGVIDRLAVITPAPIVVRDIDRDERGVLRYFDDEGKETTTLPAELRGKSTLDFGDRAGLGLDSDGNGEFVFQQVEKTLVVPVTTTAGQPAEVAGVDLESGSRTWTQIVGRGTKGSSMVLTVADDDPKKVTAVDVGDGVRPQLVTVDGKKGTFSRGDLLPKSAAPSDTDAYLSLGPALVRLRAGETETELLAAYGR